MGQGLARGNQKMRGFVSIRSVICCSNDFSPHRNAYVLSNGPEVARCFMNTKKNNQDY